MSIQVENLLKCYGAQRAVNEISFSVPGGEIVGFLGPNGAGKSTTMKIISGYLQPDSGRALVCGTDVLQNPRAAKQKIGYLPESNALYYDMYIREYLGFMADIHRLPDSRKAIQRVIEQVGLSPERGKKIGQLSKGYKQRVGLAAALIHNPEVLILDEPTTGLDPNQIMEIREVIKTLGKEKTILFSSHILPEVEAICNRVIIIHKGNLVADDTLDRLRVQGAEQQTVTVTFEDPVAPKLLQSINTGTVLTETGNRVFRIQTSQVDAVKKQVLELSLQHSLNIVSLHTGAHSLEAVFRQLTAAHETEKPISY